MSADSEQRAREHFDRLTHAEQAAAIRRMAADGFTDDTIAHATRLSREMVREIIAARAAS